MALPRARSVYAAKSRFPEVSHDVCYKVPVSTTYGDLCTYFTHMVKDQQLHNAVIGISPVDIYQRPDDKEHKQITFRLNLASRERTLTDNEVNALVQRVSLAVTEKFGAELL
jgi:phenylalanyl-tRNA synthetase beta subunit